MQYAHHELDGCTGVTGVYLLGKYKWEQRRGLVCTLRTNRVYILKIVQSTCAYSREILMRNLSPDFVAAPCFRGSFESPRPLSLNPPLNCIKMVARWQPIVSLWGPNPIIRLSLSMHVCYLLGQYIWRERERERERTHYTLQWARSNQLYASRGFHPTHIRCTQTMTSLSLSLSLGHFPY